MIDVRRRVCHSDRFLHGSTGGAMVHLGSDREGGRLTARPDREDPCAGESGPESGCGLVCISGGDRAIDNEIGPGLLDRLLRRVLIGATAGCVAGVLIGGVGGRATMAAVALLNGDPVRFNVGTTEQMIVEVTYRGIGIGILYGLLRAKLPGPSTRRAVIFGAALVGIMLALVLATNWKTEFARTSIALSLTLFGALFFLYGLATEAVAVGFDVLMPKRLPLFIGLPLHILLTVPAVVAGGLGLLVIVAKDLIGGR